MPRPRRDEQGEIVRKNKNTVPDAALRDTENVPPSENIDEYFAREVLPCAPDAWIDKKKTKVGYEIPMTRYFYKYQPPEPVEEIWERIGKIPEEWNAQKLKYCTDFIQEKYDNTLGELSYIGLENIVSGNGQFAETESQYDKMQSLVFAKKEQLIAEMQSCKKSLIYEVVTGKREAAI